MNITLKYCVVTIVINEESLYEQFLSRCIESAYNINTSNKGKAWYIIATVDS